MIIEVWLSVYMWSFGNDWEFEGDLVNLKGRFDHLLGRFDHLWGRFDHLWGRFDHLWGRFDHLLGRFDHLWGRFDHLLGRFDHLWGIISWFEWLNRVTLCSVQGEVVPVSHSSRKEWKLADVTGNRSTRPQVKSAPGQIV